MLFPALFALGGAFFFFVLRVQGADGSFPKPLTPDEEAVLLRRMQQDGDAEAREKLIEHNLRLVAHIMKKYYAVSTEQDDLLSIGTIGLIKAVNTFKADKNIRLATYASKCIQNELLMYFRQKRKSAGELSLSDTLESDGDGNALALLPGCQLLFLLRSLSLFAARLGCRDRLVVPFRLGRCLLCRSAVSVAVFPAAASSE